MTVGLLPGSGGTQRLPRMIGLEASLPILLEGRTLNPQAALKAGLVDQVVPADQLLEAGRKWLLSRPDATREWDRKGYKPSNGLLNGNTALTMSMRATTIAAQTQHNYPAPITILRVPVRRHDAALRACTAPRVEVFRAVVRRPGGAQYHQDAIRQQGGSWEVGPAARKAFRHASFAAWECSARE